MPLSETQERNFGPLSELTLRRNEFQILAEMLHAHAGILLADSKISLMSGRLAKRVRLLGLPDFRAYVELVAADAGERRLMIEALTTNHTGFFRESHHFEHLATAVLPDLIRCAKAGRRVRIWSAGCSSGEEPYTIAMCLAAAAREIGPVEWLSSADIAILATDLSSAVLDTAKAGRYTSSAAQAIPKAYRMHCSKARNGEIEMSNTLRSLVAFRRLNLLDEWPMQGQFDAIFCRNVMIYFDEPTKARLCGRFADALVNSGHLYIGHSERIVGDVSDRLRLVGQTTYRCVH